MKDNGGMLAATETANKQLHNEWLDAAIACKTEWEREIERCKRLGIEPPNPLPHPDDIVIDVKTGDVRIKGPMTPGDKKEWVGLRERKADFQKERDELGQFLIDKPDYEHRAFAEGQIAHTEKLLAMFTKMMPDSGARAYIGISISPGSGVTCARQFALPKLTFRMLTYFRDHRTYVSSHPNAGLRTMIENPDLQQCKQDRGDPIRGEVARSRTPRQIGWRPRPSCSSIPAGVIWCLPNAWYISHQQLKPAFPEAESPPC